MNPEMAMMGEVSVAQKASFSQARINQVRTKQALCPYNPHHIIRNTSSLSPYSGQYIGSPQIANKTNPVALIIPWSLVRIPKPVLVVCRGNWIRTAWIRSTQWAFPSGKVVDYCCLVLTKAQNHFS